MNKTKNVNLPFQKYGLAILSLCTILIINPVLADCTVSIIPTAVVSAAGTLDFQGTVNSTTCSCPANSIIRMSVTNQTDAQVSRWLSMIMTAKMTSSKLYVFSQSQCQAGWYTNGEVLATLIGL
jgi:hypothetical protein